MKKLLLILALGVTFQAKAQLVLNTSQPLNTLVQDFVGQGVTISNVTFTGGPFSIGSFSGSSSLISSQGIVFSSGNVDANMAGGASFTDLSAALTVPGDFDLDMLVSAPTFDAAVLEFDFVATNSTLLFDYVFASEEYNEFVNSPFNDVFGFFISGPGITGNQNIAMVPNSAVPVSINNVNNGQDGLGPCVNCAYYHDNTNDLTVAFDGFTVPLTATYTVVPGLTYHLKLAVADVFDMIVDTGVFLQKYSLRSAGTTGIGENILANANLFVYDNILNINLPANLPTHCAIYSVDGKKINSQLLTSVNSTIDISALDKGIYSVVLDANGVTFRKKIAVQ